MADVTKGVYVRLEAKEDRVSEVADFLRGAQPLAEQEPETTAWFAIQMGPALFGIFDVFPDDSGRQAHLNGPIAAALMEKADELLSEPPRIEQIDVLAGKLPA
jgi:quinol monooxygenase YgiN